MYILILQCICCWSKILSFFFFFLADVFGRGLWFFFHNTKDIAFFFLVYDHILKESSEEESHVVRPLYDTQCMVASDSQRTALQPQVGSSLVINNLLKKNEYRPILKICFLLLNSFKCACKLNWCLKIDVILCLFSAAVSLSLMSDNIGQY